MIDVYDIYMICVTIYVFLCLERCSGAAPELAALERRATEQLGAAELLVVLGRVPEARPSTEWNWFSIRKMR